MTTLDWANVVVQKNLTISQCEIAPLSPAPFAEVCLLKMQRLEVALLASTKYKTYVRVDSQPQKLQIVICLIDTGAGTNFVKTSCVHSIWAPRTRCRDFLKPRSEKKPPNRSKGVIVRQVQKGDLRSRVWFGID